MTGPGDVMVPDTDMLTTAEAISYLGISDRHFRRHYAARLPSTEGPGGRKYYARSALETARAVSLPPPGQTPPAPTSAASRGEAPALLAKQNQDAARLVGQILDQLAAEREHLRAERDAALERERALLLEVGVLRRRRWWRRG